MNLTLLKKTKLFRGLHGKRDCHEILKDQVEISLGSTRNHGDEVMVFVSSFLFQYLWFGCAWLHLFYVWWKALTLCLWCHIIIGFHGFLLVCYLVFPFMFEDLGNWLGKREWVELGKSWMKLDRQGKTQMKLNACIRATKGKHMAASWIGWVHWGKWMVIWQSWER